MISAALFVIPRARSRRLAAACAMVFLSLWIDKVLGLVVAGFVPSPMEALNEYTPTVPEILIAGGIWAAGALMITVFYKIVLSVRGLLRASA